MKLGSLTVCCDFRRLEQKKKKKRQTLGVFERLFIWLQKYSHMKCQLEIKKVDIKVIKEM